MLPDAILRMNDGTSIPVGQARVHGAFAVEPVDLADFDSRIVLAYTGVPRNSGINNWEVMKAHINGDRKVQRNFDEIAAISYAMRLALEKRDWREVGRLVRAEWEHQLPGQHFTQERKPPDQVLLQEQ